MGQSLQSGMQSALVQAHRADSELIAVVCSRLANRPTCSLQLRRTSFVLVIPLQLADQLARVQLARRLSESQ